MFHGRNAAMEAVYRKIANRVMPLVTLLFVVAYLDRVNVGFAKLHMASELRFSETVYGFGAGIFFLGYFLFEIPSNLLLERIGARRTVARIAFLWGLTSIATMFVRNASQFYIVRFLLGAFEAGLVPGIYLYLTYWFPRRYRAQMTGLFQTAVPTASIVGGPLSGWILGALGHHGSLANWQWLFLIEGVPSLILGLLTLAFVVNTPAQAAWLTPVERQYVLADLDEDRRQAGPRTHRFTAALREPGVWLLTLVYFCLVSASPTLAFWGPTIISDLGVKSDLAIGWLSALPNVAALVGIVVVGRHSDRTLERRSHCALCCLSTAVGLILIGVFASVPLFAFIALVLAVTGVLSAFAPFWQMPTTLLTGTAAAGGIALINSLGNLSGFAAPFLVGWLKDVTGTTSSGLFVVAGLELLAALLIVLLTSDPPPVSSRAVVVAATGH